MEIIKSKFAAPAVVALLSFLSVSPAQTPQGCPDQGCKLVKGSETVSGVLNTCGTGIRFTLEGFTYEPSSGQCPTWVSFTPAHEETGPAGATRGRRICDPVSYYDVTKQDYSCQGCGLFGWLGLTTCCLPSGKEKVANTLPNCNSCDC